MTSSLRFIGGHAQLDGRLVRADLTVADGTITGIDTLPDSGPSTRPDSGPSNPPDGAEIVDCRGRVVSAGFIDLQCNGANGIDLTTEPDRIADVAAELPRFGVTAFLPTVVTAPASTRAAAIDASRGLIPDGPGGPAGSHREGAVPLGLHFEGPMISRSHLGAHAGKFAADPVEVGDEIDRWVDSGVVALVTLAPELDGALEVVERLRRGGIVVSAGHTAMTPDEFGAARRAGLTYVTHLFNAMAPFGHRSPGPIGAVLADPDVTVGLICDGLHVDPVAVAMAWRTLGPGRMSLVSDASPALGAPYGSFNLGGFELVHDETGVRTLDGVLAGSALPLDRAVRNLVDATDCTLVEALATVTTTPADLLGLADRGRLRVGARADLTILDHQGHLDRTVIGGTTVWSSR